MPAKTQSKTSAKQRRAAPVETFTTSLSTPSVFSEQLLQWFDQHGRTQLPWQANKTAYRVWVSEIMLQQTQVTTVIPYFEKFMQRFPKIADLAAADIDEVLGYWAGLGYYARGRNLHAAARMLVENFAGHFPEDIERLSSLPGIGRSTAGAILSIACGRRAAILDGNVKRVLCRHEAVEGWPGDNQVQKQLWQVAEIYTPQQRFGDYSQAIMDLGATLCTPRRPRCSDCPLQSSCQAYAHNRVNELPASKPKAKLPERACQVLILENAQGDLLLERRPPSGIWGGLWCLPEADPELSPTNIAEHWQQQGMQLQLVSQLPLLRHTFSHFRLNMTPLHFRVDTTGGTRIQENDQLSWQPSIEGLGVPAPLKKILNAWRAAQ